MSRRDCLKRGWIRHKAERTERRLSLLFREDECPKRRLGYVKLLGIEGEEELKEY